MGIKARSIVKVKEESGEGIVTAVCPTGVIYVMWKDGSCGDYDLPDLEDTGREAWGLELLLQQINRAEVPIETEAITGSKELSLSLDRYDLLSMIKSQSPSFEAIEEFAGAYGDLWGCNPDWKWDFNKLESLSETELLELYLKLKSECISNAENMEDAYYFLRY